MDESLYEAEELASALQEAQTGADFVKFARLMVEDQTIPMSVRHDYWGFLNKERILTISGDKDRIRSENRLCILRNLEMMGMPHYSVDITMIREFQNTQNRNTIQTSRSVNGFERQALTTQIKQIITNKDATRQEKGFLTGLKRKLGFGKKPEPGEAA